MSASCWRTLFFATSTRAPGWPKCSPLMVRTVRVPDDLLRANRDSLAVRFYGRAGSELIIAIHRDLIDSYLQKFDSVSAALRKN